MKKVSKLIVFLFVVSIFSAWPNTKVNAFENTEEKLVTTTMDNYLEYEQKEK